MKAFLKGTKLNRGAFLALMLFLTLLLAACVRPLRDEEATAVPEVPDVQAPAEDTDTGAPSTDQPVEGTEAQPGEAPAGDQTGAEPTDAPAADQPADSTATEQPPQPVEYIVQAGDTLENVAQRYNISVDALALANNLTVADALTAGQRLVIPVGEAVAEPPAEEPTTEEPAETTETGEIIHTVQAGENLFRIGLRYGVSYQELAAYNNIANPNVLEVGQQIRIPPKE